MRLLLELRDVSYSDCNPVKPAGASMSRRLLSFCLLLSSSAALQAGDKILSEDQKLFAYFKDNLDAEFKHRPIEATRLGDHRFDGELDDISAEARQKNRERWQRTLDDLPRRIDYKKLSRAAQIDFEIFEHQLKRDIWLAENTDAYAHDPRIYNDLITDVVYLLFAQSTAPPG